MSKIEFDYQKAMSQAKELDEISSDLKKLSKNKYDQTLTNLSNNWKGDSANSYLKKGNKLSTHILETAKDLGIVADNIRKTASIMKNAEQDVETIAKTREYK